MTSYKTPDAQTFSEALSNYLGGSEWQENVTVFVKSNCDKFYTVDEFDHEHHALWRTYQDICESILGMALEGVGGSIESLEKALDEVASIPSKGPREEVKKEILEKLMTFNDFDAFAHMMSRAANETSPTYSDSALVTAAQAHAAIESEDSNSNDGGVRNDTIEQLLTLGFERDLIDMVVAGSPSDAGLEDLVMTLSEMQAGGGPNTDNERNGRPARISVGSPGGGETKDAVTPQAAAPSRKWPAHLEKFAKEGDLGDLSELHAKFVMARSLLDTFIDGDISPGVVLLVQWATDMVELHAEIELFHARKQSMTEGCEKRPADKYGGGLVGWFAELEETRRVADDSQVAGTMLSDDEVARMAELDRIAGDGTEDEQLLHSLISRHDEVQKTINSLHQRCGAMCGPGTGVSRQTLEELYLYLKEKVNEGNTAASGAEQAKEDDNMDLAQLADELHERVYNVVDSAHAKDIINILLEMHIMEDEQTLLRQKIDSTLGSPSRAADAKDSGSSPRFFAEEGKNDTDMKAAAKDDDEAAEAEAAAQRQLSTLKEKHKGSLKTLKDSLEHQKNKHLSDLEARLMRRRMAKEKELKQLQKDGGTGKEETELRERLEAAEAEIQHEIDENSTHYDKLRDSIVGGFKKACIHEINATKAKGSKLSEEEIQNAHKEAAEALKARYLRDRKALTERLEAERNRRRMRMTEALLKRKRKLVGDASAIAQAEDEAATTMEEMEAEFEAQEKMALADPEERVLLGLAGVFSDVTQLKKAEEGGDGDDFFDDEQDEGGSHESNKRWLDGILQSRDAFMLAGQSLQDKLNTGAMTRAQIEQLLREAELGADGEVVSEWLQSQDNIDSSDPVGEHMLEVLTNAFAKQMRASHAFADAHGDLFDAHKTREGILEEFKKSKGTYDEALEHAKKQSKDAIARRRAAKRARQSVAGTDSKDEDSSEAGADLRFMRSVDDYENAVDSFLEDGLSFSNLQNSNGARNPSLTALVKDFDGYKFRGAKPSKIKRQAAVADDSPSKASAAKQEKRALEEKELAENKEELANIKSAHQSKEGALIAALELEMQRKKSALKARVTKRRAKREADAEDEFGQEAEAEIDEEAAQMQDIEAAFDKAVNLLKKTEESRLHGVNVGQLIDVMNRFANKAEAKRDALKRANSSGGMGDIPPDGKRGAPLPPITNKVEAKDSHIEVEVDDFMSDLGLNALEPFSLSQTQQTHVERQLEERRSMADKVTRIADTFNEENQKLDLMMKIQQARQKQSLQRKLLARKGPSGGMGMTSGGGGGGNMRGGAGFSSGSSAAQPAVRGLSSTPTREEALASPRGPSIDRQHAMNVSSRGMAMNNLIRK